ncbi:helix-turn-helix domain-containing protein [Paenibacillus ginsengarvi]|uniref:Helix-turn-helix domain-containing protein n=1 Tax=Paenibacillus ginsengarvi TaxID=400777 RepID=A0A3B0CLT4_9BACL|nr:helix-turn-helix domain-containing protein [Paenibacillus ginsengarvi]RKN85484.1 helix-turn-helix domain-containing protein [Paenibacillus ginsengarvi]
MRAKLKQTSIYYKYMVSSAILLVFPLMLLGYSGYNQLVGMINRTVEQSNREMLEQIGRGANDKLIAMNKIAGRIASNPELTPYALGQSLYNGYQAKRLLEYKMTDDFIHELFLYIRGDEVLYSPLSTYQLPLYINDIYRYSDWNEERFRRDLNTSSSPALRPAEPVKMSSQNEIRFVTYMVPIPVGSQNPYGTVLFLIKEDALLNTAGLPSMLAKGAVYAFDERHRLVSSSAAESMRLDDLYEQITAHPNFSIVSLFESDYYLSYTHSDQSGWTFATLLPVADVMNPVTEAAVRWGESILLIFLLGGAITYFVVRYNYNPIRRLAKTAEAYLGRGPRPKNELDAVQKLISSMAESNRQLGQTMEQNREAIRQHLLLSLLKGEIETPEKLAERCADAGIRFEYGEFLVFMLDGIDHDEQALGKLAEQMQGAGEERIHTFRKEGLEQSRHIYIACTDCTGDELTGWFERLHQRLRETFASRLTIGVGRSYADLTFVGRSFIEASTAIDYKLIRGSNKVIHFGDIPYDQSFGDWFPRQELEQFNLLLRQGGSDKIASAVQGIADKIKQSEMTLFAARCVCYDIINTVMDTAYAFREQFPERPARFPDVLTLMQFDTVEELAELITEACVELALAKEQNESPEEDRLMASLIGYMKTHYNGSDFSVQKMADDLSLSMSYISRYFKERTGRTITDYLNHIRIEAAKEMLKEEVFSIKEIVQQVGYYDDSSFIRKFKALVGMTPGEYRKLHKT